MARNNKNKRIARKNKKQRSRYVEGSRIDMRQGGRVCFKRGGAGKEEEK